MNVLFSLFSCFLERLLSQRIAPVIERGKVIGIRTQSRFEFVHRHLEETICVFALRESDTIKVRQQAKLVEIRMSA
jgi:hypothetical protein